jgi:hypothetical protein
MRYSIHQLVDNTDADRAAPNHLSIAMIGT